MSASNNTNDTHTHTFATDSGEVRLEITRTQLAVSIHDILDKTPASGPRTASFFTRIEKLVDAVQQETERASRCNNVKVKLIEQNCQIYRMLEDLDTTLDDRTHGMLPDRVRARLDQLAKLKMENDYLRGKLKFQEQDIAALKKEAEYQGVRLDIYRKSVIASHELLDQLGVPKRGDVEARIRAMLSR